MRISEQRAALTKGIRGHDLTDKSNVYIHKTSGQRICQACRRERAKRDKEREEKAWMAMARGAR